jgi:hypothetical protein
VTVLWLLPLFIGVFFVGAGLAWPVAYRAGREAWSADDFDTIPATLPPSSVLVEELVELRAYVAELQSGYAYDVGHRGLHRWDDENVPGSDAQVRRRAALREPTQEFAAIVATSYTSGEFAMIGQPGRSFLRAHLAAAT